MRGREKTYVFWDVNVVNGARVKIDSVESFGGAVNDFQARSFFDSQVD